MPVPFSPVSIEHGAETGVTRGRLLGTTDLAAWIPLNDLEALPLGALAQHGLILLSARSART